MSAAQPAPDGSESEYFDAFAEEYETILDANLSIAGETGTSFTRRRMRYLRRRLAMLPVRVMDFGCGVGLAIPHWRPFPGSQVVGFDVSPESVRIARERHRGCDRVQVSLPSELEAGDFDLVYASGVFHHIPAEERHGAASFIWDTLRPGGVVVIAEHNPWNPATRYLVQTCPFDEDAVLLRPRVARAVLETVGFQIVAVGLRELLPWPPPAAAAIRALAQAGSPRRAVHRDRPTRRLSAR